MLHFSKKIYSISAILFYKTINCYKFVLFSKFITKIAEDFEFVIKSFIFTEIAFEVFKLENSEF